MLFDGLENDLPIGADSDGSCFRGNACINLISRGELNYDIDQVRDYIEANNLIEITENEKSHLLWYSKEDASNSNYNEDIDNCIYPDTMSSSSLIDNIRNR